MCALLYRKVDISYITHVLYIFLPSAAGSGGGGKPACSAVNNGRKSGVSANHTASSCEAQHLICSRWALTFSVSPVFGFSLGLFFVHLLSLSFSILQHCG